MNVCYSSLGSVASPMPSSSGMGFLPAAVPLAAATGPAAPFVLAATALLGPMIKLLTNAFKGCGQTCVQATQYANQAEQALKQVNAQYAAQPVHYLSAQQHALALIDQLFNALHDSCSNPALGPAGQRCISERLVKGGTAPWCPNPGHTGCDWITLYRDPIANDPHVVNDPPVVSTTGSGLSTDVSIAGMNIPVVLLAGIGLLVMALMMAPVGTGRGRY
jgi:hypothetical protein